MEMEFRIVHKLFYIYIMSTNSSGVLFSYSFSHSLFLSNKSKYDQIKFSENDKIRREKSHTCTLY